MLLNSAFAHEQIYPHIHPHTASSPAVDTLLSLLWFGGLALLAILLVNVTRQLIHTFSRRRED